MKTRTELEKFCEGKPFTLSEHADKVIIAINRRNGNCPCRKDDVVCPCPEHAKEVFENGACHCNLFIKRGLTIVELMVFLSIFLISAALCLPAFARAKHAKEKPAIFKVSDNVSVKSIKIEGTVMSVGQESIGGGVDKIEWQYRVRTIGKDIGGNVNVQENLFWEDELEPTGKLPEKVSP